MTMKIPRILRCWPDPPIRGWQGKQPLVCDAVEARRPLTGCAANSQTRPGTNVAQLMEQSFNIYKKGDLEDAAHSSSHQ